MKNIAFILILLFTSGCASQRYAWSNSDPSLHNQRTLNRDRAICNEYANNVTMGMPTSVAPSGYNVSYGGGYATVTERKTVGDSLSELGMTLGKEGRRMEAYQNCMESKGWEKQMKAD